MKGVFIGFRARISIAVYTTKLGEETKGRRALRGPLRPGGGMARRAGLRHRSSFGILAFARSLPSLRNSPGPPRHASACPQGHQAALASVRVPYRKARNEAKGARSAARVLQ